MSCIFEQPGPEERDYILRAQLFNTRNLSNMLKAIHFKEVRIWQGIDYCNQGILQMQIK